MVCVGRGGWGCVVCVGRGGWGCVVCVGREGEAVWCVWGGRVGLCGVCGEGG